MDLGYKQFAMGMKKGVMLSSFALLGACGGGGNDTPATTTATATTNTASTATSVITPTTPVPVSAPVVVTPPPPPARYLKLDGGGNELPANASDWSCVKDKETGLVWEAKTNDGGLRDKDWRYRHFHNFAGYASNVDYNGNVLCQNLGTSSCDAYSYVNGLQGSGLCGRSDWRLPLQGELLNLVKYHDDGSPPNIDRTYFSDTVKGAYCTENTITNPDDCGYASGSNVSYNADGRIECNYQGVDFGAVVRADNPRGDSMVALRFSGEVQDGKTAYPNANWICYTRLVSGQR